MKYVGSKNRIAKHIAPIIQSYIDSKSDEHYGYLEPFVGGANMIDKIKCPCKIGNDSHKYLIALLDYVSDCARLGIDKIPDTITKEEYNAVRANPDNYPNWYVGLVGFCASYNGKWFGGYANGVKTKIGTVRNYTDEAIKNLKKQAPKLKDTMFVWGDFRKLCMSNMVIYCDPPYRDTTKYAVDDFPYDEFYAWCQDMTKRDNIVLVSEYWMPEDDFECIWYMEVQCTLDNNSRSNKVEKLFICKPHD